jgi:hypothetical protein
LAENSRIVNNELESHLSGLMVSVLANGPKINRFKLSQGDGFLRAIKSAVCLPLEGK